MININLDMLSTEISEEYDVFICSSSYEKRCFSACINLRNKKFKRSFIVYNHEFKKHSEENMMIQKDILKPSLSLIETKVNDPLLTADNMKEEIISYINLNSVKNVLLDITTFTHEGLLILIKLLCTYCPLVKITCVYTNAEEYSIGDNVNNKWLSKGIEEVRAVLGYSGDLKPANKTHLVIIVGYEFERAVSMINIIEPNILSLGYAKSANTTVEKNKEANYHYSRLVWEMSPSYSNANAFEISCGDPYETYNNLNKHVKNFKNDNILIAPMNNKISTIGVGLLALKNKKIQICYGPALAYNILNYSSPGNRCYIFDIF